MSRVITVLALLQPLLIILGFFALGAVLKVSRYPDAAVPVRWNPLAVFLREHGLWFLALPLLWAVFAASAQRLDRGFFSNDIALGVGLSFAIVIIGLFLYAAAFPYVPLHIHPVTVLPSRG